MLRKSLLFDKALEEKFSKGIKDIAAAVKSTLGPGGNPVIIQRPKMSPLITKDGVTVAQHIRPTDPFEELIAQSVIEIAEKTNQTAGDGTTSAVVLAEAIYNLGKEFLHANPGVGNGLLVRQIIEAVEQVKAELDKIKVQVSTNDDITNVARVSANGDIEIATVIASAMDEVGQDGVVTVEEGTGLQHTLRINEGTQIDKGWLSELFITDQGRQQCILEKPYVIIIDEVVRGMQPIFPIIQQIVSKNRPFLVICDGLEGEALETMAMNARQGGVRCAFVKAPMAGATRSAVLEDLALLSNTRVYSVKGGNDIQTAKIADLGKAEKVVVSRTNTVVVGGGGSATLIQARIQTLKEQIEVAPHQYDKDVLKERIARLTGGVATIGVGAATDLEMKEKKDRIEDALHATRAAIEDGVVPGGGVALLRAVQALETKQREGSTQPNPGQEIIFKAALVPFQQILINIGYEPSEYLKKVKESNEVDFGFDAAKLQFNNLFAAGVIDPTKVVKQSLTNAASIASLLLTSRCAIALDQEDLKRFEESLKY